MRRTRVFRAGCAAFLIGWAASAGCTHNNYYGYAPVTAPCGPTAAPFGSVCDVPTQVIGGGAVVAQTPSVATGGPRPPRVVVSEPSGGSRFGWRRSDPDSGLATTRVEGALDDPTVTK